MGGGRSFHSPGHGLAHKRVRSTDMSDAQSRLQRHLMKCLLCMYRHQPALQDGTSGAGLHTHAQQKHRSMTTGSDTTRPAQAVADEHERAEFDEHMPEAPHVLIAAHGVHLLASGTQARLRPTRYPNPLARASRILGPWRHDVCFTTMREGLGLDMRAAAAGYAATVAPHAALARPLPQIDNWCEFWLNRHRLQRLLNRLLS
jgi:hypothetical protein